MSSPSRRLVARTLGVLSCVVGLVLTSSPGALAASRTVPDATDDVYSLTDETPTKVSGPDGDIVSVTTVHGAKNVRVRVRARHLSLDQTILLAKLRTTPGGPAYFFSGTADIGMRMAIMTKGQARIVVCRGIWMRFRPGRGYVTAVIPRSCLGNPRWVRAGAALMTTDSLVATLADDDFDPFSPDGSAPQGTLDIAGVGDVTAAQLNSSSAPLPLGPRVRRG
jgi:hypothetical protein